MCPRGVAASATNIEKGQAATHQAGDAGPRPPEPVALMQGRHKQDDQEGDAPECQPDLEYSSGIAG